jgi:hypothetical protein
VPQRNAAPLDFAAIPPGSHYVVASPNCLDVVLAPEPQNPSDKPNADRQKYLWYLYETAKSRLPHASQHSVWPKPIWDWETPRAGTDLTSARFISSHTAINDLDLHFSFLP